VIQQGKTTNLLQIDCRRVGLDGSNPDARPIGIRGHLDERIGGNQIGNSYQ
jgi:hypothetical protein